VFVGAFYVHMSKTNYSIIREEVKAIRNYPAPPSVSELRSGAHNAVGWGQLQRSKGGRALRL